ncbi:MAG TPA: hypothetical protein ACN46M_06255, partial [Prochlorococcus sp.]
MTGLFALLMAWRWPLAIIVSTAFLSRTLIVIARAGIRVEIFTRRPISVSTGPSAIQAEVTKVR